jgi:trigger factor
MPERRVRARLEKSGQMDALRNQIIERKVIDRIVQEANVTDEPAPKEKGAEEDEFAVYHSVLEASETQVIPEARYDDNTPRGAQPESERE